jgi:hypothetical protein
MAMLPKSATERIPDIALTEMEQRYSERIGLSEQSVQDARRRVLDAGYEDTPIRRLLWARTNYGG